MTYVSYLNHRYKAHRFGPEGIFFLNLKKKMKTINRLFCNAFNYEID